MLKPFIVQNALNLSGRSPFSMPYQIGIPPAHFNAPDIAFVGGLPTVKGIPLATAHKQGNEYLITPSGVPDSKANAQPSFQAGQYGNSGSFRVDLVANTPTFVLKRPANTRVQLTIQNLNAVGVVSYNFDGSPSTASSIQIAAGGNRLWDSAVPQGDLWLIAPVNATVVLEFINKDLTDPNT